LKRPDPESERPLIEAAQRDPRLFAGLYERNFERIYAFVAGRVHNREEAEDITAEVFQQALANLPRFQWRGVPFAAWLFKIAANAMNDHYAWMRKEREASGFEQPAEAYLEQTESRARLFRLVGQLPADQRGVLVMRFAEQRTIREIALLLGRTEGAVKQLQFRGLKRLRASMDKADG
jgi:RNA polymerase sigma-70 factor (ECF subfamily)